jgi:hypothetical protein
LEKSERMNVKEKNCLFYVSQQENGILKQKERLERENELASLRSLK